MELNELFQEIVENNEALSQITTGLMSDKDGGNKENILVLIPKKGNDIILSERDLEQLLEALGGKVEGWKAKADKWDKLDEKIGKFYFNEEGEEIETGDLGDIGEAAAIAFGYL